LHESRIARHPTRQAQARPHKTEYAERAFGAFYFASGDLGMAAAKKSKGSVGVIGLGIMGGSFAKNLAAGGWHVIGYDISAARRSEAKRAGVEIATNAADVVAKVATVITSLPKPQALIETARAIVAAKLPPKTIVEMSTFNIEDKEKAEKTLRKAGHVMLDTPVSGTGSQAKTRDLVFYASGDTKTIKRIRPMLEAFGRRVYDVGTFGNGSRMKYVANLLVAINNVASAEAMVLGMKAGLDPQMIFDLIQAGAGNSRVFELRVPMMVKNNYDDVTMKIDVWDKDMRVIGDYARKIRVPTPMFDASKPIYIKAMKSGRGAQDTAAVCAVLESMAKFKRTKSKKKR
jgi:L-threonate 2-dehydrogenase